MAKNRNSKKRPPRKDGAKRTKRQRQVYDNNLNWRARKYYARRDVHKAERGAIIAVYEDDLRKLRKENSNAVELIASLRAQLNDVSHELAELRKKR